MVKKLTYEALEQRVVELEKENDRLRRSESSLLESKDKYYQAFESEADAVMIFDAETRYFEDANTATIELYGYSKREFLSLMVDNISAEIEKTKNTVQKIREDDPESKKIPLRYFKKKDGTVFPGEVYSGTFISNGRKKIIGVVRDISERQKTEEALQRSELKAQQYLEVARIIFLALDSEGNVTLINKHGLEILGYQRDELIGKNWVETCLPERLRSDVADIFHQLIRGEVEPIEYFENPVRRKDGEERVIVWHNSLLRDTSGKIIGTLSSGNDNTERKQMEEEHKRLEAHLQQAYKMEAIGTLAGGIAHDFNNILTPIIVQSELAMMDLDDESPIQFNLQEVIKASHRARDLVKQILTFSRQTEHQPIALRITPLIKEVVKLLRASLPTTINIRLNLAEASDAVIADPVQIHQVLMNLCTNAAHAMRENGGELEIGLVHVEIDTDFTLKHSELQPGPHLKLTVSDTGYGIAPDLLDRIFEPFFTTKERSEGTGMGLSVVHGIIKNYGGAITVESEIGKGTTFNVILPRSETSIEKETAPSRQLLTGSERVLIVDDEKGMVDTLRKMLVRLGYQVTDRTSSIEALEAFRSKSDQFDFVITDQTMPNMSGDELAREIMKIRSDIPIILCTGFSEMINEESAKEMGISAFVMKPIIMNEIADTIREVLDNK